MRKRIEIQIPDLFALEIPIIDQVYEHIKKQKRTTATLASKICNCSMYSARTNLERLLADNKIKDLGMFTVRGKSCRVFEINSITNAKSKKNHV
ncbi:MAG: hypothetical protein ACKO7N_06040 [Candidatus Nitrosotenuis sp.]